MKHASGRPTLRYLCLAFALLPPLTLGTAAAKPPAGMANSMDASSYEVTIHEDYPLVAHIKARLQVDDTLTMSQNCPNYDYPEGWSSFVRDLTITQHGKEIPGQYVSKSTWVLEHDTPGIVDLSYSVDLSFTQIPWDVGNEQAGYFDGNAVYLVSKSLFIHGIPEGRFVVEFNIPKSWKLSVPWAEAGGKHRFEIANLEHLLENSLVYGDYAASVLRKNGFVFESALLGDAVNAKKLFEAAFQTITGEFLEIFPDTAPSKFLVTMFYSSQDDGESFYNSNAFTLSKELQRDGAIIWANQMAHELFHYWDSDLIKAADYADRQWFSEGFAEYYANLTLLRTGIIDEPSFRSKAEKVLGLYLNFKWRNPDVTLKAAGQSKGKNRFAVYNGGWAAAFFLDLLIIEKTDGEKNLDDFMRLMFERFTESPYEYGDLVATASDVVGEDISWFFRTYVDGKEPVPVEQSLNKIGYKVYGVVYEAELYLAPQEDTRLRNLWLRNDKLWDQRKVPE